LAAFGFGAFMKIGICCNLKSNKASRPDDDSEEEFDSPITLESISKVLNQLGHECFPLPESASLPALLLEKKPDFVFNFAEGRGTSRSRESRVPALLEIMGIPYSGSDPFTLCITLDKDVAKSVVSSAGIPTPKGWTYRGDDKLFEIIKKNDSFPFIAKPAWEGSSKGIPDASVAESLPELIKITNQVYLKYQQPVLIEEFLTGREFTIGIVGNGSEAKVIGAMEVEPITNEKHFVYSIDVKRNYESRVKYHIPPRLNEHELRELYQYALQAYKALDCKDLARLDFRMNAKNVPYFLEANPLPGLNPLNSDMVFINRGMGQSYESLIEKIFNAAISRIR